MTTIHNVHNQILDKIKSGTIKQTPRWHFVLQALLYLLGFAASFIIFFYFISFVALVLREHYIFEALQFGPRTLFAVMHTLPFLLILIVIGIFIVLQLLVRHFAFAYMKPIAVTAGAGLLLTFSIFALILFTDRQFRIARLGEGQHIPPIDFLHSTFRDRIPRAVVHGTIVSIATSSYIVRDVRNGLITLVSTDNSRMRDESYSVGDRIGALVEKRGGSIFILGMHNEKNEPNEGTSSESSGEREIEQ